MMPKSMMGMRTMATSLLLLAGILLLYPLGVQAQKVQAELKTDQIIMGQQTVFLIEAELPISGILVWPELHDTLTADIEIIRHHAADTLKKDDNLIFVTKKWVVTAWKDGFFPIPPLDFLYISDKDTLQLETRALLLQVGGVEVNMEEGYRDIKPIWHIPPGLRQFLPYIIATLLLGGIVYWFWRRSRKQKPERAVEKLAYDPGVPAHIAAISGLETLRRKKLWQKDNAKLHHSELTTIIRIYISRRFGLQAMEMTTAEILEAFSGLNPGREALHILKDLLQLADLVKFAKYKPGEESHENAIEQALKLIQLTMPVNEDKQETDG